MSPRISLTQYLVEKQREKGLIPAELRMLLEVVARACKRIGYAVSRGAIDGVPAQRGEDRRDGQQSGFAFAADQVGRQVKALHRARQCKGFTYNRTRA